MFETEGKATPNTENVKGSNFVAVKQVSKLPLLNKLGIICCVIMFGITGLTCKQKICKYAYVHTHLYISNNIKIK